jgi:uncharacterized protein (TIGR00288 family)
MSERAVILIDGENVIRSWKTYCYTKNIREKIDYVALRDLLAEGTNLLRAYFYDGVPEQIPAKKKEFLYALQAKGIQLRTKVLKNKLTKCQHCGFQTMRYVQKGVDVSLATDILRHAFQGTCDICIVVSGDEDYKDAIDVAKDKGIKIWVAAFRNSLSHELKKSADKVIFLDEIFPEIKQKI